MNSAIGRVSQYSYSSSHYDYLKLCVVRFLIVNHYLKLYKLINKELSKIFLLGTISNPNFSSDFLTVFEYLGPKGIFDVILSSILRPCSIVNPHFPEVILIIEVHYKLLVPLSVKVANLPGCDFI